MPRVLNLGTGREHDVPAGHFSLTDAEYRVLPEPELEPKPVPVAAPKPVAPKARARKE